MHSHLIRAGLAATMLTTASAAGAQEKPSPLYGEIDACRAIADDAQRLACFDKAAGTLSDAVAAGNVAIVDREQVRKVRRSLFGFSLPKFPFFGDRDDEDDVDMPKEVITKLTSFKFLDNDRYMIGIEEPKSVWVTTESVFMSKQDVGTEVTIRTGAIGSFFIKVGKARWVRARRVQ